MENFNENMTQQNVEDVSVASKIKTYLKVFGMIVLSLIIAFPTLLILDERMTIMKYSTSWVGEITSLFLEFIVVAIILFFTISAKKLYYNNINLALGLIVFFMIGLFYGILLVFSVPYLFRGFGAIVTPYLLPIFITSGFTFGALEYLFRVTKIDSEKFIKTLSIVNYALLGLITIVGLVSLVSAIAVH